tara:strand:- start:77 stop:547 length:471 start_codon:yes stop_codon:yes gene_type:complete
MPNNLRFIQFISIFFLLIIHSACATFNDQPINILQGSLKFSYNNEVYRSRILISIYNKYLIIQPYSAILGNYERLKINFKDGDVTLSGFHYEEKSNVEKYGIHFKALLTELPGLIECLVHKKNYEKLQSICEIQNRSYKIKINSAYGGILELSLKE